MTTIRDIPYEDIKIFLDANNKNIRDKDDAYDQALKLLKNKKAVGHTTNIVEWMIAHNLLINNIDVPYYTTKEIDYMSQSEINRLAKKLTMKSNNKDNIINILRYLHKLEDVSLLPEINEIILNNLTQLELQNIDISKLTYDGVIDLLQTHRNKKEIRKLIYHNLEKIIIYNSIHLDIDDYGNYGILDDLLYLVTSYNKDTINEIIMDNKQKLKAYLNDELIKNLIIKINEINDEAEEIYIGPDEMNLLIDFTFNLIEINEIGLAKNVFEIANKLHYFAINDPYNYHLLSNSVTREVKILEIVIELLGKAEFLKIFDEIIRDDSTEIILNTEFLENLVKLHKYQLLVNILKTLSDYFRYNYRSGKARKIDYILIDMKEAIEDDNEELILTYVKSIKRKINNSY